MNIAIISTSPRKESNSLRFAKHLQNLLQNAQSDETEELNVSLYDFEACDIPMIGRGMLHKDSLTPFQQGLIDSWKKADLVFFAIPEYNWMPSGEFINAIDQLAMKDFSYLFNDKVFALAGVSIGRGGRMPVVEISMLLNKVINFTNNFSVVSPRLYESHETSKNIDENGNSMGNEVYDYSAKAFVDYSLKVAKRWQNVEVMA